MPSLLNWKFTVETGTGQGNQAFRLIRKCDEKNPSNIDSVVHKNYRYIKCIFPVDIVEGNCKNPNFACKYEELQKKLRDTGYNMMWTLHGLLSHHGSNIPPVEHTTGRKRKRVPTFTLGDDEDVDEDDTLYTKGILLALPENNSDTRCEICKLLQEHQFNIVADIDRVQDGGWMCNNSADLVPLYLNCIDLENKENLDVLHPAFYNSKGNLVFHSLEEVKSVLDKCPSLNGISDLKKVTSSIENHGTEVEPLNYPFIVIEGLDGTGKSTLLKSIVSRFKAIHLQTPPKCLLSMRQMFDGHLPLFKRMYYSIGNYLVAADIISNCQEKPVIMDRFWHSTAAYTIATECKGDITSLPPAEDSIYDWPEDLPQPSLVILLSVSEESRSARLDTRLSATGEGRTREEQKLDADSRFRQRVEECYRRMKNPKIIEVSANGTKEEVFQNVHKTLQKNGINL